MRALYLLFTIAWAVKYSSSMSITSVGCGSSKVCLSQPPNCDPVIDTGCYFMSAMAMSNSSEIVYELSGRSDGYVSFGFSNDQIMGNDDIYICGLNSNNTVEVQHAFSPGRTRPTILPLGNVSLITASMTDGVITCAFTSRNPINTTSVDNAYFLMFAYGSSNNGTIRFHGPKTFLSNDRVDIFNPQIITTGRLPLTIKSHGSLMLIAWMTISSLGMFFARYFKKVTEQHKYRNIALWFWAHSLLMVLSVTMTIIAFILVFVYIMRWSGGVHPILGCLVMSLSLIQPIGAAFRCAPDDGKRYIFNWLHGINAAVIKILAVAAIFTGLVLVDRTQERWLIKVMGGFVGWEALFYLLQDAHMWAKKKGVECISELDNAEVILLVLFLLGNLAFLVALLFGIATL